VARSKISFSYDGIGAMLRSAGMEQHMIDRAKRIMEAAQASAPVYSGPGPDPTRGSYKAAFRVESTLRGGRKNDRAAASVVNDDYPVAFFIEYGTREHTVTIRGRDGQERAVTVPAMAARHILGSAMMAAAGDE
jgi:hypothetical protein